MKNKIIIAILILTFAVCLCFSVAIMPVGAEETKSGVCGSEGSSVSWVLNIKTGVLQISGGGSIADYSATATVGSNAAPWRSYADSVDSIIIKEGITKIGKNAFAGLTKLKALTLPEGLTKIEENAFLHCGSLGGLEIPSTVTEIGKNAFANCGAIESITVDAANTVYRSDANCLIQISNETVIRGSRKIELPTDVKYIGEYAFSGSDIKALALPESIIYMGYGAFADCNKIEEITVPFVGDCRLDSNGEPTYTHPGDTPDADGTRGKYRNALWYLFGDNGTPDSLKKVTLTDSVTIGNEAFSGEDGITDVVLPKELKVIGASAFDGCSSLKSIVLPEGLEKINASAFKGCVAFSEVTLPDSVSAVGVSLFDGCVKLERVKIGKGITKLGEGSFYRCPSLSSFEVSSENTVYYAEGGCIIEKATAKLVVGCKNTVIPSNIKIIGVGAFRNCISLTKVTLPEGLTEIERSAFESCTGLTEIVIPDKVTSIGASAFAECVNLKSVKISKDVKVGDSAFKNCTSLDSSSLYVYSGSWGVSNGGSNAWIWWIVAAVGAVAIAIVVYSIVVMKKRKE